MLWEKIASDEMPKGEHKLSPQDKARIHDWIEQGAATARPEPEDVADARFTVEELEHWAFQPLRVQTPPGGSPNPIDAFIRARLEQEGLGLSEPADRRTLIRRLSFDLTGLPPTPEEVADFVGNASTDADETLVTRLLESPQFGVRWRVTGWMRPASPSRTGSPWMRASATMPGATVTTSSTRSMPTSRSTSSSSNSWLATS